MASSIGMSVTLYAIWSDSSVTEKVPVAKISVTKDGSVIRYDATGSENYDLVRWTFGDGYTSFSESGTHRYSEKGTYHVVLTVFNGSHSSEASTDVVITETSSEEKSDIDIRLVVIAAAVIAVLALVIIRFIGLA